MRTGCTIDREPDRASGTLRAGPATSFVADAGFREHPPLSDLGTSAPFRPTRRQGGFSLLEVVIAFAILALSLGLLIQIFSQAMSTTALSGDYSRAATLAEAQLNSVGIDIPLELGDYGGEAEDGLSWRVVIESYEPEDEAWDPGLDTYLITSVVSWDQGVDRPRRVSLSSLRLLGSSALARLDSDEATQAREPAGGEPDADDSDSPR